MNSNDQFLSGAMLKDKAKGALTGNYGRMILAALAVGMISLAAQFIVSFLVSILFNLVFISKGLFADGLTREQVQMLLTENAFEKIHGLSITVLTYIANLALSIPVSVFQIGISLCCLNIACGRTMMISDIFYGFRYQFGKSIKLAAVFVLISQFYALPGNVFTYLTQIGAPWPQLLLSLLLYAAGALIYVILSLNISQMFLLFLDFPGYSAGELIRLSARVMKGHKARLFCIQLSFIPLMLLSVLTFFIGDLWLTPYMNLTYTFFFLNLMQAREKSS